MLVRAIFLARPLRMPALVTPLVLMALSSSPAAPQAAAAETVVVIVARNSTVTELPRLHLADLYLGRISRFPDGNPALPINQKAGTKDRTAFSETYLGRSETQIKAHWSKLIFTGRGRPPAEAPDESAVRKLVAEDPRAIGYVDRRFVDSSVRIVRVR
jgi:ABC-type phosphate transport system substrate-binding protein